MEFINFRFSDRKSQSQQKLAKKIIHFAIQCHSKNPTYFTNLKSFNIRKNILPQHSQKNVSGRGQEKTFLDPQDLHCRRSVYSCKSPLENFFSRDVRSFYLVGRLKNFSDKLQFKGKIGAKFLLRSHFLSMYNNMRLKQQINHGVIQKVSHLHNGIFHSASLFFTLCQFYSITSPVLLTNSKKLWN